MGNSRVEADVCGAEAATLGGHGAANEPRGVAQVSGGGDGRGDAPGVMHRG